MSEPLTDAERKAAAEYALGLRRCKKCGERIRWTGEDSRRVLCDECWDARELRCMRRTSRAMAEVLRRLGPESDPEELGKALVDAAKASLKEEP